MIASAIATGVAGTTVGLGAALFAARQCRRPFGASGRSAARLMNRTHQPVTQWGLGHVAIGESFAILDIGCGGGQTVGWLASKATSGSVCGIDYSEASVTTARQTNARLISEGRVDIRLASVSSLPFEANRFDLVTAVETHYYWPHLSGDLREVLRVLKPGGMLALVAETYRGRRTDWLYRPAMLLLGAAYLTPLQHHDALALAGFTDVRTHERSDLGWICAIGRKPAPETDSGGDVTKA